EDEFRCYVSVVVKKYSLEEEKEFIHFLTEDIIRKTHKPYIVIDRFNGLSLDAFSYAGYYAKGNTYQKKVDAYRLKLEDDIFDREGYIIHQGKMTNVPFGWFKSDSRGCGWIGAYNLLHYLGIATTIEKCASELSHLSITGKIFGQDLFTLYHWLRKQGAPVKLMLISRSLVIQKMKQSEAGILLYTHKRGAHYTMYRYYDENTLQFYNAIYGRKNHRIGAEKFFKDFVLLPIGMLIYVE
ncbi:MAG: hypothetical protein IJ875_00220, partial [Solobacterium sp.]|nr:hypothetical protein [Solobacterium sp.]